MLTEQPISHCRKHELLRTEIIALVAEARALERNVIVAIGAIWALLVLHPAAAGDRWIWWSPTFIVLGRVHTTRKASMMSANERNPRNRVSSFSNREKIRRKPLRW